MTDILQSGGSTPGNEIDIGACDKRKEMETSGSSCDDRLWLQLEINDDFEGAAFELVLEGL